jgi:RNA processing factor Prp31
MKRAREGVQKELASQDHIIVQVVGAIDELNKISNLAFERLNEWYGLHFPEFSHKDPVKYTKLASFFDRSNPQKEILEKMFPDAYSSILQKSNTSVGVMFALDDMSALQSHAKTLLSLYELKNNLEKYEESIANRLCPNITAIAGPKIASQLVAHAGSLKKLALMPSSTIQVIGAEKALFKHLKSGSPSPKHGLIFSHPHISMAPKHARGKIARALASKLTIAAKADAFSKNNISEKLKSQFEARVQDILKKAKDGPSKRKISAPIVQTNRFSDNTSNERRSFDKFSSNRQDSPRTFSSGTARRIEPDNYSRDSQTNRNQQNSNRGFSQNRTDSNRSEGRSNRGFFGKSRRRDDKGPGFGQGRPNTSGGSGWKNKNDSRRNSTSGSRDNRDRNSHRKRW